MKKLNYRIIVSSQNILKKVEFIENCMKFIIHFHSGKDGALNGFMSGFALNAFAQLTANFTIISYAVTIFERTGTSIDPYISSIILALALIIGSLLTTYLADMLGRKILNIVSLAGSAVGLFTVSIYYYFHINNYDLASFVWVPVVSLSFVVFISSAGINALAYVCSVECLPSKVCKMYEQNKMH